VFVVEKLDDQSAFLLLCGLFPEVMLIAADEAFDIEEGLVDDESLETMLYVVWPFVARDILVPALESEERNEALASLLAWIELCMAIGDSYIQNFIEVCPIERILGNPQFVARAGPLMGPLGQRRLSRS
jgi:hypothetical protein